MYLEEAYAHVSSRPMAKEGTNAHPGEAVEKHENAGAGAALQRESIAGIDADGFA